MKGISLPVQMIVIVVICILVLLVVSVFFSSGFIGGETTITDQQALLKGCSIWRARGCELTSDGYIPTIIIENYKPEGTVAGLGTACKRALGLINEDEKKIAKECLRYCCGKVSTSTTEKSTTSTTEKSTTEEPMSDWTPPLGIPV